jgi:hypothetical protein
VANTDAAGCAARPRDKLALLQLLFGSIVFVNLVLVAASYTQLNSLFHRLRLIEPLGYWFLFSTALLPIILACEITVWFFMKKAESMPSRQSRGAGPIWIDIFIVLFWIIAAFFLVARGIASWVSI